VAIWQELVDQFARLWSYHLNGGLAHMSYPQAARIAWAVLWPFLMKSVLVGLPIMLAIYILRHSTLKARLDAQISWILISEVPCLAVPVVWYTGRRAC
jgi:hypothetical protein